jgi:hypothetical protein
VTWPERHSIVFVTQLAPRVVDEKGMESSSRLSWACAAVVAWMCVACQPDLGVTEGSGGSGSGGSGGGAGTLAFTLEPPSEPDAVSRSLRIRVGGGDAIDPELVRFVEGEVGPGHLKQLAVSDPSNALEKRLLPASVWRDGDDVVVAPHALLEEGEHYAVAVPDQGRVVELRSRLAAFDPVLPRIWPPMDALAIEPTLIFCAAEPIDVEPADATFGPGDRAATIEPGAVASGAGRSCVRVRATEPVEEDAMLIPPPAVGALGLDPTPLVIGDPLLAATSSLSCEAFEVPFGRGCARILDDRALVRTSDEARLWVVAGPSVDLVVATTPGEPFTVHPLAVDAAIRLNVVSYDAAGGEESSTVEAWTSPASPHLVLNEALANAVGPEPASEWVEIVNDGALAASLAGHVIADLGGEVELPDVVLPPHAIALVVGDGWTGDGLDDVAPPPDAIIVRVPRIGRSGIANGGEPLRLRDPSGAIVSTIPSIASPEPGMSTARREPWLADAPSSFVVAVPTPGAPNDAP